MQSFLLYILFWPTLLYNILLSKLIPARKWYNSVDDTVILGALPYVQIRSLFVDLGVTYTINMCKEWRGPVVEYASCGIKQLWLPTIDFTAPSSSQIETAIAFIEEAYKEGTKVYLHCKAGRGRSATVAIAWVMKSQNLSPVEAQKIVQCARPHVNTKLYKRDALQKFASKEDQKS